MTNYAYSGANFLSVQNGSAPDNAETDHSRLFNGWVIFPGAQFFNEIMLEGVFPKITAPSGVSQKFESDR